MVHDIRPLQDGSARPLRTADAAAVMARHNVAKSRESLAAPDAIQQLEIRPPTVLVADDEAQIVDLLCLLLEDEGFRVVRAYDGFQAWRLTQEQRPDLIITDVMMPGLTGVELTRRVKQRGNAAPPVILMSAVTDPSAPSGTPFLAKPFDINHLLDLVMELTERPATV